MNDTEFQELLSAYLDGELSAAGLARLRDALHASPERERIYRQQRRIALAELAERRRRVARPFWTRLPKLPSLNPFSLFRLCRGGAMLMNTAILGFAIVSFQNREPLNLDVGIQAVSGINASATGGGSAAQMQDADAAGANADSVIETASAGSESSDSAGTGTGDADVVSAPLAEEYGFVRL
ncbi:MAG: zf-HC2 domain-containing protein [Puniceicoccales bacterium]|jgi:hypothetical protein|nr:zf-HC2 domain-containing protein [Puniceicoccales bacterium]